MFILLSPKKNNKLKIGIIVFLAIIFGVISYLNIADAFPKFLEQNKLFNIIAPKLSYQKIINDERFKAWETFSLAIKDRPILGWGPENLAVGFDKFYNPKITQAPWWDKAHNIFLDIGVQAGILGILAYVFLLFALFLSLHKAKRASQDYSEKIVITGIQSALLGYIVANFFSLDSMPSYILFFLIIAYTLNLSLSKEELKSTPLNNKNNIPKKVIMAFVFCVLILFLWQYNYFPLIENGKMNFAEALARNKRCNEAIFLMDEVLNKKNFLYTYAATQYVDLTIACNNFYPEKYQEYIKSGFEIVKEAVKKRPLYTRFWISLGSYANSLAQREQDTDKRSDLLNQAEKYFDMAEKLSPQPPRNNDWKGYNRIGVERLSKNA